MNIPPGPNILQTRQMFLKVGKSIKSSEAPAFVVDHESMNKFELAAGVLGVYKRKDRRFGSARFWCDYNGSVGMNFFLFFWAQLVLFDFSFRPL